jgi:hypothetical protein
MTTFASWVSVDSRGPSAIYLVADSRISWSAKDTWDQARKVFACRTSADIFGYLGDVQFPSLVLGQICDAIDTGCLLDPSDTPESKFEKIGRQLRASFKGYPQAFAHDFEIGYATRCGEKMHSRFRYFSFRWSKSLGWSSTEVVLPITSETIFVGGSGAKIVEKWKDRWRKTDQGGTSRAIFSSVCDAILSGEDPFSGGLPQLVGIYRNKSGRDFGFCDNGVRAMNGMLLPAERTPASVEWRNRLFELCHSDGTRISDAQQHIAPRGLGRPS